jgi:hypothetical protein
MNKLAASALALLALSAAPAAHAGVYGDDLGRCLVASTSDTDKSALVKWMFAAMSLNKEVAQYVNMPADVRERINDDAAKLYMRLLTVSCRKQTHDAFKYEGAAAISTAFNLLGQVAAKGLFEDPAVNAGMEELTRHIDEKELDKVLQGD